MVDTNAVVGIFLVMNCKIDVPQSNYGIQNETSDLRVHVCPLVGRVYVYDTQEGTQLISNKKYNLKKVYTNKILTALGVAIPIEDILTLRWVDIPKRWLFDSGLKITKQQSTVEKGKRAEYLVALLVVCGPSFFTLEDIVFANENEQIQGIDIKFPKLQVKCDFRGGHKSLGGTGNLFLQTAERNLYGQF